MTTNLPRLDGDTTWVTTADLLIPMVFVLWKGIIHYKPGREFHGVFSSKLHAIRACPEHPPLWVPAETDPHNLWLAWGTMWNVERYQLGEYSCE